MSVSKTTLLNFLTDKVRAPIQDRDSDIQNAIKGDQDRLTSYVLARADLDALITSLQTDQFKKLADKADKQNDELKAAVKEMNVHLNKLNDFIAAADIFTACVGLAARIAAIFL